MWRGCGPTVGRAVILNAAQLGTYDQAKQMLMNTGMLLFHIIFHFYMSYFFFRHFPKWLLIIYEIINILILYNILIIILGVFGNGLATHFTASLISGFISTAVSIPIGMSLLNYIICIFYFIYYNDYYRYRQNSYSNNEAWRVQGCCWLHYQDCQDRGFVFLFFPSSFHPFSLFSFFFFFSPPFFILLFFLFSSFSPFAFLVFLF